MLLSYGPRVFERDGDLDALLTVGAQEIVLNSVHDNVCGHIGISFTPRS